MPQNDSLEQLQAALESVLPAGVAGASARIGSNDAFDYPEEAALRVDAGASRQQEFIAGRRCAREALRKVGCPAQAILADDGGAPTWPDGYLGSISHSKGLCAAIGAKATRFQSLGLDLEQTNRLSPSAHKHVVHPREMVFVDEDQVRATLLFSLKETFYKLQSPLFVAQPGFQDVHFEVDLDGGSAAIVGISEKFGDELRKAASNMRFAFAFTEGQVVSLGML